MRLKFCLLFSSADNQTVTWYHISFFQTQYITSHIIKWQDHNPSKPNNQFLSNTKIS
ncbi:uncharacterized protein METZ01_LOCUS346478, partial [marine metagenome]